MARPELGEKRRCLSCDTKFYDLNKDPAICPKCGVVFELEIPEKIEPKAAPVKKEESKAEVDNNTVSSGDPDTISLEDADDDDGDTVDGEDIPDDIPDVASDDDEANSEVNDAFLDQEDDDENMSDLVNVSKDNGVET